MENKSNGQYAKGQYHVQLKKRAQAVYNSVTQITDEHDAVDSIFGELKDVALESWKNGIQAGKRKASQKTAQ
jgi:hypothetical protein